MKEILYLHYTCEIKNIFNEGAIVESGIFSFSSLLHLNVSLYIQLKEKEWLLHQIHYCPLIIKILRKLITFS